MKIVLGIEREAEPAVTLLNRLKFPAAHVDVVHVLAPSDYLTYGIDMGLTPSQIERIVSHEDRDARSHLETTREALERRYTTESHLLFGPPARDLGRHAALERADLVAVNAAHTHSEGVAALTGSVARSLVMGAEQSVLIARGAATKISEHRPLRVVFATDHSEYANRCWENFLSFAPGGVEHIGVVSAFPKGRLDAAQELLPKLGVSLAESLRDETLKRSDALIERTRHQLFAHELTFASYAMPEPVHEAIDHAMDASSAELLVLGAKGHGLIERLTLGSVSMRQAIAGPYSTLILRAPS
jgi:nucleotide-binding universal stress UspA family protein